MTHEINYMKCQYNIKKYIFLYLNSFQFVFLYFMFKKYISKYSRVIRVFFLCAYVHVQMYECCTISNAKTGITLTIQL